MKIRKIKIRMKMGVRIKVRSGKEGEYQDKDRG